MHVASFFAIFYYSYIKISLFYEKIEQTDISFQKILDLHSIYILVLIVILENGIISPIFRFNLLMRLGAIIMIFGYFFCIYSHRFLLSKDKKFLHSGPYRYMRHPVYFGFLVSLLGAVIYTFSWLSCIYFYFLYKNEIKKLLDEEEQEIISEEQNYKKYMHTVKRFYF